jgi:hypothetical protein
MGSSDKGHNLLALAQNVKVNLKEQGISWTLIFYAKYNGVLDRRVECKASTL